MNISRRQFIGLMASMGAASCAKMDLESVKAIVTNDDTFTFAAIGDIHVLDARSTGIVNKAVGMINATEAAQFTLMLGDLATDGRLPEFRLAKNSLDRLARPYFTIPGNHDVDMTLANPLDNFTKSFDWENWDEDRGGWVFLGLDSCNGTASDVTIRPDQVEWLTAQLGKIGGDRPIALLSHHPLNPNTKQYRVKNAEDVLALFKNHNLKLVASGHYHGNQQEERDGILFTTTACCSTTRPNFDGTTSKGYRLFHVDKETITTEYVEVMA